MWREGQRFISRSEPDLGLGVILEIGDDGTIQGHFPSTGETRTYMGANAPLQRFRMESGDHGVTKTGDKFVVDSVTESDAGLLIYTTDKGDDVPEQELGSQFEDQGTLDQFFGGLWTHHRTYDLRRDAWAVRGLAQASQSRGLVGPRVQPIPHQLYIAHEVARRDRPRVLLADEVGLGKTIEAGLIFSSLKALGRAERVLIIVPQALVYQWVSEMFRRFNTLFSVVDEDRSTEEQASLGQSAFVGNQYVIVGRDFLLRNPFRMQEATDAGWDLVIIDEAHHLNWDPEEPDDRWVAAQKLSTATEGLLLLTATPQQYGLANQFGLLHLVDPDRFSDYDAFEEEYLHLKTIGGLARKVNDNKLTATDRKNLRSLLKGEADLHDAIPEDGDVDQDKVLQALIDRHGTGRVLFRNRREKLKGFPERQLREHPLKLSALHASALKKLDHEEMSDLDMTRLSTGRITRDNASYNPRLPWLVDFANKLKPDQKVLVICSSIEGVEVTGKYLDANCDVSYSLFHEKMTVVERDKQAAAFTSPAGAQMLICSEIGGEGRNFQFTNQLVLLDLPRHPDVVEQRIGRLDRIGQRRAIQIHVPWVPGTAEEVMFRWYHEGLDSFETSWNGADLILESFVEELLEVIACFLPSHPEYAGKDKILDQLLAATVETVKQYRRQNQDSVDLLIDLNSFDETRGEAVVEAVEDLDDDTALEFLIRTVFDHYNVEYEEIDNRGTLAVNFHSMAFIEEFPGITSGEEMSITFDRELALAREDLIFVSVDHQIAEGALSILLDRNEGAATVASWPDYRKGNGAILELNVVLEATGPRDLELGLYLPLSTQEFRFDHDGKNCQETRHIDDPNLLSEIPKDMLMASLDSIRPMVEPIVEQALKQAEQWAAQKIEQAKVDAARVSQEEIGRLSYLAQVNPSVSDEEIKMARDRAELIQNYLGKAAPRLDSVRLILTRG